MSPEDTTSPVANTSTPYVAGHVMSLTNSEGDNMSVTVTNLYPITMSSVMDVRIQTNKGLQEAILKLYDRRFGEIRKEGAYVPEKPHTQRAEAAWQDYIREGLTKDLFDHLKHEDKRNKETIYYDSDSDEDITEWERLGRREATIYHKARKHFTSEVEAYEQLQALQGRCVPRFISSVTLKMPSIPSDLPSIYFQVPGILLQKIQGFNLTELVSFLPNEPQLWEEIIQNAVNAAYEINHAGVLNFDGAPRNVVVERINDRTFQPFLIDFAMSACKWQYKDTEDLHDPRGFRSNANLIDNGAAVGLVIASRVKRETGLKPKITYMLPWPYDASNDHASD
ncbi:hypothetical protein F4804DRAFT_353886 [Jackrogersella minutella]|nr:hypothetical protein F4804DRAFT_353886 [Jackrogersella minutella]